jgi:hypothetical protein
MHTCLHVHVVSSTLIFNKYEKSEVIIFYYYLCFIFSFILYVYKDSRVTVRHL